MCAGSCWEPYRIDDDGHYDVPDDLGGGLRRGVLGAAHEGLVLDGEERGEDSEDEHGGYRHDDAAVDNGLVSPSSDAPAAAGAARGELVEGRESACRIPEPRLHGRDEEELHLCGGRSVAGIRGAEGRLAMDKDGWWMVEWRSCLRLELRLTWASFPGRMFSPQAYTQT